MYIVKFTKEYTHFIKETPRWTAKPGDTPTLDRDLAKFLVDYLHVAEWVGEGCGCIGVDAAIIARHTALATRGITQNEDATKEEEEEEGNEQETESAISKSDGLSSKKERLKAK